MNEEEPQQPWLTRLGWILFHGCVILLIAYVSSYVAISRLRWKEAMQFRAPGFLYVSAERVLREPEESWMSEHMAMAWFYMPINTIDRALGGPSPILCFLRIGKKKGAD
jgi:hypothetical protein